MALPRITAVPRLAFQVLCAIAALSLSGVHYGVAQMWAWTTMVTERSVHGDFMEAVKSTFDGDHPCRICLRVQSESQKEQQRPQQKLLKEWKPLTGGLCDVAPTFLAPDPLLFGVLMEVAESPIEGVGDVLLNPPEDSRLA
jgi:hypothetical protein